MRQAEYLGMRIVESMHVARDAMIVMGEQIVVGIETMHDFLHTFKGGVVVTQTITDSTGTTRNVRKRLGGWA